MKQNSGLKNKDGKDLSIGEVFYVYNMIATAGSLNSMKTCVEQIGTYSELPSQYEDVVREFDAITESVNGDLDKLPEDAIIFGEVGLVGEIRGVSQAEQRIIEAEKMGFHTCILPKANVETMRVQTKMCLIGVSNVREALDQI